MKWHEMKMEWMSRPPKEWNERNEWSELNWNDLSFSSSCSYVFLLNLKLLMFLSFSHSLNVAFRNFGCLGTSLWYEYMYNAIYLEAFHFHSCGPLAKNSCSLQKCTPQSSMKVFQTWCLEHMVASSPETAVLVQLSSINFYFRMTRFLEGPCNKCRQENYSIHGTCSFSDNPNLFHAFFLYVVFTPAGERRNLCPLRQQDLSCTLQARVVTGPMWKTPGLGGWTV